MLRVWGVPRARPTMDIDLLRRGVADQAALVRLVEQCAAISDPSDGVIFEPTTISVEPIRDATEYVGTRIRLHARLDNVRQTVQIDFGVGDAVHPQPQVIDYPVLLTSPPVRLNAYPVEAAIAEKFEAMVHLDSGLFWPRTKPGDPFDFRSSPDQRACNTAGGVDGEVPL